MGACNKACWLSPSSNFRVFKPMVKEYFDKFTSGNNNIKN